MVNEESSNAQKTYNAALDKAEKYGKRERRYLSKKYGNDIQDVPVKCEFIQISSTRADGIK